MHERPLEDVDLPIVCELGEALYAAALAADGPVGIRASRAGAARAKRKGGSRAKRRHGLRHPPLMAMVALSALVLVAVAAAGSLVGGIGITPEQWLAGRRMQSPALIAADQSAHLGILRRSRVASRDAVNPYEAVWLSRNTFAGAAGANLALSRRVQGLPAGAAWVVPGAGRVCLIAYSALDARGRLQPGGQGGAVCQPDRDVVPGRVLVFASDVRTARTHFVAGIVPDGVSSVTLESTHGRLRLAVHENVYMGALQGAAVVDVRFAGPRGTVRLGPFVAPPARLQTGSCVHLRRHDKLCSPR